MPENFSVFLFDYHFGFIRRGLLGAIANHISYHSNYLLTFRVLYWASVVGFFCATVALLWRALKFAEGDRDHAKTIFALIILLSPLYIKNCLYDFGRVDVLGMACLAGFALAPFRLKHVLIIVLPPFLLLCHEGQIFFSVAPMIALFIIDAIKHDAILKPVTAAALLVACAASLAITLYFLLHGIPKVNQEIMSAYFRSKSPLNTRERSWLLFDNFQANVDIALGKRRFAGRQLVNAPLYALAIIVHWPVIWVVWKIYSCAKNKGLRVACGLLIAVVVAQSATFFLGIDYAHHFANIFMSLAIMLLFIIWRYDLGEIPVQQVRKHRYLFVVLLLVFLPIPRFGIVSP